MLVAREQNYISRLVADPLREQMKCSRVSLNAPLLISLENFGPFLFTALFSPTRDEMAAIGQRQNVACLVLWLTLRTRSTPLACCKWVTVDDVTNYIINPSSPCYDLGQLVNSVGFLVTCRDSRSSSVIHEQRQ